MKYSIPTKYAEEEKACIKAICDLLPAIEAMAFHHGKDMRYVTGMVLRSYTTQAIHMQEQTLATMTGATAQPHGDYTVIVRVWTGNDLLSSSDDIDAPHKVKGLQKAGDYALDYIEQYIREDEDWPEEISEHIVDRRLRTQRGNIYRNDSKQTIVNFPFLHRNLHWLMQIVLSRPDAADVRETKKERGIDRLRRQALERNTKNTKK